MKPWAWFLLAASIVAAILVAGAYWVAQKAASATGSTWYEGLGYLGSMIDYGARLGEWAESKFAKNDEEAEK